MSLIQPFKSLNNFEDFRPGNVHIPDLMIWNRKDEKEKDCQSILNWNSLIQIDPDPESMFGGAIFYWPINAAMGYLSPQNHL